MRGLRTVRKCGLKPRVSVLVPPHGMKDPEFLQFIATLADQIYELPANATQEEKILSVAYDKCNKLSNFIDIGAGVTSSTYKAPSFSLYEMPAQMLCCKGFFRPAPMLTIKANGELSLCRITNAGEGYGNLHNTDIIQLLNHLQDSFTFQVHAQKKLVEYLKFMDTSIFGTSFTHPCSVRAALTLIAKKMHDRNISHDDKEAIKKINLEVARETGHSQAPAAR